MQEAAAAAAHDDPFGIGVAFDNDHEHVRFSYGTIILLMQLLSPYCLLPFALLNASQHSQTGA